MLRPASTLASVLLGAVVWTACSTGDSPSVTEPSLVDQSTLPNVTQHCPDGRAKTEVGDGFSSTTRTYPFVVGKICVKAGNVIHKTSYNGPFGNGCYKVWGLGTYTIKLKETGYSRCKDVSYFVVYKKKTYSY